MVSSIFGGVEGGREAGGEGGVGGLFPPLLLLLVGGEGCQVCDSSGSGGKPGSDLGTTY